MPLDRTWILNHIPHQGRMCLLDEVLTWTTARITSRSGTHRAADNPLRAHGRLGVASGVEYAAQTMAVHGALLAGAADTRAAGGLPTTRPAAGFLASLRAVRLHALLIEDTADDLFCEAVRTAGDGGSALYEFELKAGATLLLSGRATVVMDASERLRP